MRSSAEARVMIVMQATAIEPVISPFRFDIKEPDHAYRSR
jgi:hypothetical protein